MSFKSFKHFWNDIQGATAIEYGIIALLVAAAIIISLEFLGSTVGDNYNSVSTQVQNSSR